MCAVNVRNSEVTVVLKQRLLFVQDLDSSNWKAEPSMRIQRRDLHMISFALTQYCGFEVQADNLKCG